MLTECLMEAARGGRGMCIIINNDLPIKLCNNVNEAPVLYSMLKCSQCYVYLYGDGITKIFY